jgi:glycosyltransferase involved in cell wall biosynthesis
MTVLEMNACGRPVIAYGKGGALETIIDGKTGIIFEEQTVYGLADAMLRSERITFDPVAIRRHAERFSKERFTTSLRRIVDAAGGQQPRLKHPERRLSIVAS